MHMIDHMMPRGFYKIQSFLRMGRSSNSEVWGVFFSYLFRGEGKFGEKDGSYAEGD